MANHNNLTTNIIDYKQRFKELLNNWAKFAPGTVDELMKFCDDQFNQLKQASKLKDNEENAYYQRMCSAIITTNFDVSIFKTSHSHSRVQVQVIGNIETVEKNMLPKASC